MKHWNSSLKPALRLDDGQLEATQMVAAASLPEVPPSPPPKNKMDHWNDLLRKLDG